MGSDWKVIFKTEWKNAEVTFLGMLTFFFFCRLSFLNFARTFHIPLNLMVNAVVFMILLFLALYTLSGTDHIAWDAIIVIFAAWLFFELTLVFHPEYQARYEDAVNAGRFSAEAVFSVGSAIYAYYVIRLHGKDPEKLWDIYKIIPYALLFLNIWTIFFNRTDKYKMDFGYQMGMAATLFMAGFLHEKNKPHRLILSLGCIAAGVLYGSRACVIGYGVFILIYFIWSRKMTIRKTVVFAIAAAAVITFFSQTVLMWIYRFFNGLGLHSRTLYLLATNNIMGADTARQDKIWPVLIEELKNTSVFKAHGVYGGRYLLAPKWAYEHNIVFEMLLTFGVVLGCIIMIAILAAFIRVLVKDKSTAALLTMVFGSFSLSRLALSSTFWQEPYFWAFLAMIVNCSLKIRRERIARQAQIASEYEKTVVLTGVI